MAFNEYDFELTETAESDIDATYEYIAETLETIYFMKNRDRLKIAHAGCRLLV